MNSPYRVLLINPRATYAREIAQKRYPPLNLLYLAASLRRASIRAEVLDANAFCLSDEAIAETIAREKPHLVGIGLYSEILKQVSDLCILAKRAEPSCRVVLGGPHASAVPETVLRTFPAADFVLRDEADDSLPALCRALESGTPLSHVGGLSYRGNDGILHTPDPDTRPDVDALPSPARDLLREAYDRKRYYTVMVRARPVDTLITSRGCPFHCGFCYNRNHRYRGRTAEAVMEELLSIVRRGIRDVEIVDDNFTADRARAMRIFDMILAEKLNVSFRIKSRVNNVNEEFLNKARRAGVYQISFGMESGVQRILDAMDKRTKVEDNARACELTRRHGMAVHSSWVIGYPGETLETVRETIEFVARIRPTTANFGILRPYPETPVYQQAREAGTLEGDWSPDSEEIPWVRLPWTRSREDLHAILKKALRRLYFRPYYAWTFGTEIARNANLTLARYALQELGKTLFPRR